MKTKYQHGKYETFIFFLISPFLSLPFILAQLKRQDKMASVILSSLVGIIGYLYIPAVTNDKARYYERYYLFREFSFSEFSNFLLSIKKPDFIFDFTLFTASKFNIRIEFVFFLLTFLCVFLIFNVINSLIGHVKSKKYNYLLISFFVLLSFSLPSLFSGLRFTLGASFLIFGIYQLVFLKKKIRGIIFIILATQTHFSLLYFIPGLIIYILDKYEKVNYRLLFLISLSFLLIPSTVTSSLFSQLSLTEALSAKTSVYVENDDFVSQNFDRNESSFFIYIIRTAWYYSMLVFLVFYKRNLIFDNWSKCFVYLLYIFIFCVNFTYSFTTIFTRFSIVLKLLFLLYIIYIYLKTKISKKLFLVILFFFSLTFAVDIYILRINLSQSLLRTDNLLLIQIINNKIDFDEFIK